MKGNWIGRIAYRLAGVLMLLALIAFAAAQDFNTYKGDAPRTGKSSSFMASGPGSAFLTWYHPNFADNIAKTMIIDNIMRPTPAPPPASYAGPAGPDYFATSGVWFGTDVADEASAPYIPTDQTNPADGVTYLSGETWPAAGTQIGVTDATNASPIVITTSANHLLSTGDQVNITGVAGNTAANGDWTITVISPTTFSLDGSTGNGAYASGGDVRDRTDYQYAECIASDKSGDPRAPLNATDTLSVYSWILRNPVAPFYEAYNYAIYVHLPTGPTTVAGVQRFPQRYYVYEVDYAGGTFTDVVDTDVTGGGWFRIGGGGLPTDKLFSSTGSSPIVVKLYNTVPRDPSTGLLTTNPSSGDDLDLTQPRPIVYADAVKAIPFVGSYAATPIVSSFTGASGPVTSTIGVLNAGSIQTLNGVDTTVEQATLTSYEFNTGNKRFTFSPLFESPLTATLDNTDTADVQSFGSFSTQTTATNKYGADYYATSSLVDSITTPYDSYVKYSPVLNPAGYDIYVWIAGDSGTDLFATGATYEIDEGGIPLTVTLDQSGAAGKGWVKLGTRAYQNTAANPLVVKVTNAAATSDVGTRAVYADAVRFVGPTNLAVTSTPVQTTALVKMSTGGAPQPTPVIIVAAENGTIYCLDADGNTDGTTNILWTYPSTPDPSAAPGTYQDPNLNAPDNIDGTGNSRIAQMPTGFGLSSPVVANIGGVDYVFIASNNGRVYCLEMAGRGDMDIANHKPGTTRRVWTYPDDFPAATKTTSLGSFVGSVAYADPSGTGATPTLYVPTMEGRMYALDAAGNAGTHTTTARWTYPAMTSPTLGPIAMTPTVDFNKVFFGTQSRDGSSPGQFMALDWATGAVSWNMATPTQPLSDFNGGPATVDGADLGGGMADTVFVSNDNRGLYALDAGTGAIEWETYEPDAAIRSPLTFTTMNVYDITGVPAPAEVVVAPLSDGKVEEYFAQTSNTNIAGGRFAGGFITQSQSLTDSVAVGWNFMYFGDNAGYIYALSNTAGSFPPGTIPPLTPEEGPNNPATADYRNAGVKMIKKSAFLQLRQGTMYYADAIDPSNEVVRTPMAFEWGETIYLLVYHFPYQKSGLATPPVINVNFTVGGETVRNVFTEAREFPDATSPDDNSSGYGVLSFTIQPAGANALPPGIGQISIGFNTTDASGAPVNYPSLQTRPVYVANPLALVVPGYGTGAPNQEIGNTNVTSDPDNLFNGNGAKLYMLGTEGTLAHGQSGTINLGVTDRSLVELIRGPGRGLQNVRVERNRLSWQPGPDPGAGSVLDPLDSALFPGFEDQPVNYPNNSLDYPDIFAQAIRVTKSAAGDSENPVNYPVQLNGPTAADGSPMTETNADTRALVPTTFSVTVNVPRYQPANEKLGNDQNNPPPTTGNVPAGYSGLYYVFVDTSGNGVLDRPNSFIQTDSQAPAANREAFRSFSLATSVGIDRRFAVLTPTVDLGSLAEGVGYTPDSPGPANSAFDPWNSPYSQIFKPFIVANEGNVNLLNLRLAKATTTDNTTDDPWAIFSPSNEDWAYLDGSYDLWSDMDPAYAPMRDVDPNAMVIGQKSRVGDRFAKQVTTNPVARPNPNTGITTDSPRLPTNTYPVQSPRVGVTIPFGFPAGTYVGLLKVIDDDVNGTSPATMWQNLDAPNGNPTEPNSDPGLRVTFKAREARVTSTASPLDAPFFDNLPSGTNDTRFGNLQPSGFRNPTNGSLVTAYASSRTNWTATPGGPVTNPTWRIYIGSVQGADPYTAAGTSPLRDLQAFTPDTTNGRWFQQSTLTANGFPDPTQDATIWGSGLVTTGSETTAKYGSPVFPQNGMLDPFRSPTGPPTAFPNTLMAFVGQARVTDPSGQNAQTKSEIFVAPVTVDNTGAVGIGNAYAMTNDATAAKGRPSILQTQNGFVMFYAATVGGRSNIYYVMPSGAAGANQYDGSYFTESSALDLGEGFESVSSPNVTGRLYRGANVVTSGGDPVIELTFTGKLHQRPVSEVFYGRLGMDNGEPTGLLKLPVRTREPIFQASEPGTYLANGVEWDTNALAPVLEVLRNGVYTDISSSSPIVERGTGIITFKTSLGGQAYLDPTMGTVRLSGANPPQDATLVLTYQPKLLRISEGTSAGYATPSVAFDERYIPDITYWRRAGDGSAVDGTDPVRTGRYLFMYDRAAAGAGQAARPILKSMRFGVNLPTPVYTDSDGNTGTITVSTTAAPLQYYQVDPAKKKIYFTADDEDKPVTITYEAADPSTGADIGSRQITATVEMIVERPEELVQLDQATDEANLSMFLDPFDYIDFRRPGLVWLFWSSTRGGAPDVYMQTIAPRFTPLITGK